MTETLGCQRALFDLPEDITYLNCAYMSPALRLVTQAGEASIRIKSEPWRVEPKHFFTGPERYRSRAAPLIGACADDIAIVPSASYGIATAAANLPVKKGQTIVLLAEQFPSNVLAWQDVARSVGAEIVTVERPVGPGETWADRINAAISTRTAVVALPHCHWTDGSLIDLEAVAPRVHAMGAALVLDLSQSLGALPIDMGRIDPDFMVAASYKWLMGPYSLACLYVAPRRQNGTPIEQAWTGRSGAQHFEQLTKYETEWDGGARRFDMGEKAQFHLLPMAVAALAQIERWGIGRIAATLATLTGAAAERALELDLDVPGGRAPHFLGLRMPGGLPTDLPSRLKKRGIYVSARGSSLRVTPHLYNNAADIDRLFSALREFL